MRVGVEIDRGGGVGGVGVEIDRGVGVGGGGS